MICLLLPSYFQTGHQGDHRRRSYLRCLWLWSLGKRWARLTGPGEGEGCNPPRRRGVDEVLWPGGIDKLHYFSAVLIVDVLFESLIEVFVLSQVILLGTRCFISVKSVPELNYEHQNHHVSASQRCNSAWCHSINWQTHILKWDLQSTLKLLNLQ